MTKKLSKAASKRIRSTRRRGYLLKQYKNNVLFHYKQKLDGSALVNIASRTITQTNVDQHFALEFRYADLPQQAIFSSLYDQYRINKIVIELIPMANVNVIGGGAGVATPNLGGIVATVIDYDNGSTALATLSEYEQYTTCRIHNIISMKPIKRVFKPHINIQTISTGGGLTAGVNKSGQWLDCSHTGVSHHGFKFFIPSYSAGAYAQTWTVMATYYVSFKYVR